MERESIFEIIRVMGTIAMLMRAIKILIDLVHSVVDKLMIIIGDTIYSFLSLKCYTARVYLQ